MLAYKDAGITIISAYVLISVLQMFYIKLKETITSQITATFKIEFFIFDNNKARKLYVCGLYFKERAVTFLQIS